MTDVVREARETDFSSLATKADLTLTKADLTSEIGNVQHQIAQLRTDLIASTAQLRTEMATSEARLSTSIAECKADILKWVIGLLIVQGGAAVTLVKLLLGH